MKSTRRNQNASTNDQRISRSNGASRPNNQRVTYWSGDGSPLEETRLNTALNNKAHFNYGFGNDIAGGYVNSNGRTRVALNENGEEIVETVQVYDKSGNPIGEKEQAKKDPYSEDRLLLALFENLLVNTNIADLHLETYLDETMAIAQHELGQFAKVGSTVAVSITDGSNVYTASAGDSIVLKMEIDEETVKDETTVEGVSLDQLNYPIHHPNYSENEDERRRVDAIMASNEVPNYQIDRINGSENSRGIGHLNTGPFGYEPKADVTVYSVSKEKTVHLIHASDGLLEGLLKLGRAAAIKELKRIYKNIYKNEKDPKKIAEILAHYVTDDTKIAEILARHIPNWDKLKDEEKSREIKKHKSTDNISVNVTIVRNNGDTALSRKRMLLIGEFDGNGGLEAAENLRVYFSQIFEMVVNLNSKTPDFNILLDNAKAVLVLKGPEIYRDKNVPHVTDGRAIFFIEAAFRSKKIILINKFLNFLQESDIEPNRKNKLFLEVAKICKHDADITKSILIPPYADKDPLLKTEMITTRSLISLLSPNKDDYINYVIKPEIEKAVTSSSFWQKLGGTLFGFLGYSPRSVELEALNGDALVKIIKAYPNDIKLIDRIFAKPGIFGGHDFQAKLSFKNLWELFTLSKGEEKIPALEQHFANPDMIDKLRNAMKIVGQNLTRKANIIKGRDNRSNRNNQPISKEWALAEALASFNLPLITNNFPNEKLESEFKTFAKQVLNVMVDAPVSYIIERFHDPKFVDFITAYYKENMDAFLKILEKAAKHISLIEKEVEKLIYSLDPVHKFLALYQIHKQNNKSITKELHKLIEGMDKDQKEEVRKQNILTLNTNDKKIINEMLQNIHLSQIQTGLKLSATVEEKAEEKIVAPTIEERRPGATAPISTPVVNRTPSMKTGNFPLSSNPETFYNHTYHSSSSPETSTGSLSSSSGSEEISPPDSPLGTTPESKDKTLASETGFLNVFPPFSSSPE